jgi:hypothetical protein
MTAPRGKQVLFIFDDWTDGDQRPSWQCAAERRKLLAGPADAFFIGLGMLLQPGSTSPEQASCADL